MAIGGSTLPAIKPASETATPTPSQIKPPELFDLQKALEDARQKTAASREAILPVLQQTLEVSQAADQKFQETVNLQTRQADQAIDKAGAAMDQLQELSGNPAVFNRFMSLFDSDYSEKKQKSILAQSQFQLQTTSQRVRQAAASRDVLIQSAARTRQAAQDVYTFNRQNFLDTAQAAQLGFALKEGIRKELVTKLQGTKKEDLTKWLADPKSAPMDFQGQEELIRLELFERRRSDASLSSVELANAMQRRNLDKRVEEDTLAEFTLPELQKAFRDDKLPAGVSRGAAKASIDNLQLVQLQLNAAKNAAALGDLNTAQAMQAFATDSATLPFLENALGRLESAGATQIDIGGVPFNKAQLQRAIAGKKTVQAETDKKLVDLAVAYAGTGVNQQTAHNNASTLGGMLNPDNPIAGIPSNAAASLQATNAKDSILQQIPGEQAALERAALWEAEVKTQQEFVEEFIKSKPKEQQGAYREFADTGRVQNMADASSFLLEEAGNPAFMAHSATLGVGAELLANELASGSGLSSLFTVDARTGERSLTLDDEKTAAAEIQEAVKKSGAKEAIMGAQFQEILVATVVELATPVVDNQRQLPPTELQKAYGKIVNSETGQLSSSVMVFDEATGTGTVNRNLLNETLAEIEITAKEQGLMSPDQSLIRLLYAKMRDNAPLAAQDFQTTVGGAALARVLYGGVERSLQDVASLINEAERTAGVTVQNTNLALNQQKRLISETAQALKGAGGFGTGP